MLRYFLKNYKYIILTVLYLLLVYSAYVLITGIRDTAYQQSQNEVSYTLNVAAGSRWHDVIDDVVEKGVYKNKKLLLLSVYLGGHWSSLKSGEYMISPLDPWVRTLESLSKGKGKLYRLTILPGSNWHQLLRDIRELPIANIEDIGPLYKPSIEGFFMPESYSFSKNFPLHKILSQARGRFDSTLNEIWSERDESLRDITSYQLVTIASLIEREAQIDVDRPKIARVIYNRLNINMPLQIDASMVYVAINQGEKFNHLWLKKKNPYNTYLNKGLPPGPIAYPSKRSLYAAAHPEIGSWLYYRLQCNGEHTFSHHFKEHVKRGVQCQR